MIREIGMIFLFSGILAIIFMRLRQPMIPAYVLAGICMGPLLFNLVTHPETISELSDMAVVIMLFIIGIEMDLSRLKKIGLVAIGGGIAQVLITFIAGYFAAKMFGLSIVGSIYIGLAASFSSTMLVVKMLGDNHEVHTLIGKITIGILIMQDIFAIFALSILNTLSTSANFSLDTLGSTLTMTAGLILIIVFICGKFILPKVFKYAASDREILIVVTMAVLFLSAFYAESQKLSLGIGSFLVGLSIAELAYKHEIIGDLKALKSFFTVLFFASLGLQITTGSLFLGEGVTVNNGASVVFSGIASQKMLFIVSFLVVAMVVKPFATMIIVRMLGHANSTAFKVGNALGQLSEFSLILIAQGVSQGHIPSNLLSPIIIATLISMTIASYSIKYSWDIYKLVSGRLGLLTRLAFIKEFDFNSEIDTTLEYPVILVGRDKMGRMIEEALKVEGVKYLVIDANPDVALDLKESGTPFLFGSIQDSEVSSRINFKGLKTLFSTMPGNRSNELLIKKMKKESPDAKFIGIVDSCQKADDLYDKGAYYVLLVHVLAGMQLLGKKTEYGLIKALLEGKDGVRRFGRAHCGSEFCNSKKRKCPI